jgi:hypothetical protein
MREKVVDVSNFVWRVEVLTNRGTPLSKTLYVNSGELDRRCGEASLVSRAAKTWVRKPSHHRDVALSPPFFLPRTYCRMNLRRITTAEQGKRKNLHQHFGGIQVRYCTGTGTKAISILVNSRTKNSPIAQLPVEERPLIRPLQLLEGTYL